LYPRLQESIDELDQQVGQQVQKHPQARRVDDAPGGGAGHRLSHRGFPG
jgi:dihydroxyacetone kinase